MGRGRGRELMEALCADRGMAQAAREAGGVPLGRKRCDDGAGDGLAALSAARQELELMARPAVHLLLLGIELPIQPPVARGTHKAVRVPAAARQRRRRDHLATPFAARVALGREPVHVACLAVGRPALLTKRLVLERRVARGALEALFMPRLAQGLHTCIHKLATRRVPARGEVLGAIAGLAQDLPAREAELVAESAVAFVTAEALLVPMVLTCVCIVCVCVCVYVDIDE